MKKTIGLILMIAVLLITFSSTDYVDAASYDSKATISFKKGEDKEPGTEDEPGTGDIPSGIIDEEDTSEGSADSKLPKTATMNYSFLLIGFLALVVGAFLYIYSRYRARKKQINNNLK